MSFKILPKKIIKFCDICGSVFDKRKHNANLCIQIDVNKNEIEEPLKFGVVQKKDIEIIDIELCDNCFESGSLELPKMIDQLKNYKKQAEEKNARQPEI